MKGVIIWKTSCLQNWGSAVLSVICLLQRVVARLPCPSGGIHQLLVPALAKGAQTTTCPWNRNPSNSSASISRKKKPIRCLALCTFQNLAANAPGPNPQRAGAAVGTAASPALPAPQPQKPGRPARTPPAPPLCSPGGPEMRIRTQVGVAAGDSTGDTGGFPATGTGAAREKALTCSLARRSCPPRAPAESGPGKGAGFGDLPGSPALPVLLLRPVLWAPAAQRAPPPRAAGTQPRRPGQPSGRTGSRRGCGSAGAGGAAPPRRPSFRARPAPAPPLAAPPPPSRPPADPSHLPPALLSPRRLGPGPSPGAVPAEP